MPCQKVRLASSTIWSRDVDYDRLRTKINDIYWKMVNQNIYERAQESKELSITSHTEKAFEMYRIVKQPDIQVDRPELFVSSILGNVVLLFDGKHDNQVGLLNYLTSLKFITSDL